MSVILSFRFVILYRLLTLNIRCNLCSFFDDIGDDQRTTEEILDEAKRIQAQSKESTTRSKKVLEEINETGNATLGQLQQDRAKLEEVHADLEEMDSDLRMAQNQLKGIARKLSKDNIIRYVPSEQLLENNVL